MNYFIIINFIDDWNMLDILVFSNKHEYKYLNIEAKTKK